MQERTKHSLDRSLQQSALCIEEEGHPEIVWEFLVGVFDREPHQSGLACTWLPSNPQEAMMFRHGGIVAPFCILFAAEEPLTGIAVCRLDCMAPQVHVVESESVDDLARRQAFGLWCDERGALMYWPIVILMILISKLSS